MSECHTLFIIASDEFRARYLDERMNEVITLVGSTLVGLEEPSNRELWSEDFQRRVLRAVEVGRGQAGLRVRFAGHYRTCFGDRVADGVRIGAMGDRSFPDMAAAIKVAASGDTDVQVWGFSHSTDISAIWGALVTVKKAIESGAEEEVKREFERRLVGVFENAGAAANAAAKDESDWERREHLSVIAHDIMGQFNPLRLNLDTAAFREVDAARSSDQEYRKWVRDKAEALRAEVAKLLPEKLEVARAKLGCAVALVPGGEGNADLKRAADKLAEIGAAGLDGQPAVIQARFRRWADELNALLRALAR